MAVAVVIGALVLFVGLLLAVRLLRALLRVFVLAVLALLLVLLFVRYGDDILSAARGALSAVASP